MDTATNRVFTLDCYVYAPDLNKPRKRNYMRGLEHLLYSVRFPGSNPRFRRATPNRAMRRNRRICSRY